MAVFIHPSALLEAYVREDGTDAMHEIMARRDLDGALYVSDVTGLSIPAALGALRAERKLAASHHARALSEFLRDYPAAFHVRTTTPELIDSATDWALRHAGQRRLPPDEVLQLAAAISIGRLTDPDPVVFVARDQRMLELARGAGFDTFDPSRDDPDWLKPLRLEF